MKRLRTLAGAAALLALAAAVPLVQRKVDARLGGFRAQEDVLYLWSGRQLKRAAPGFEDLLADVYWLRTVQYFGGKHAFSKDRNFALLEPLIDITVTLDPRLEIAYQYGSIFLAEPPPVGAGRPHAAVALLERGARDNPNNWRLRKELGYFYFLFLDDPHTAARILMEAAEIPGAAYWLRTMAADFLARGGDLQTSRDVWRHMYEDSAEGAIKHNALVHLQILDARETRQRLQGIVDQFAKDTGRRPAALQELARRGYVTSLPLDPTGVPFDYDAGTGKVSIARSSSVWRPER